ncbi:MAG TPA: ATP-dependent DNA helicase RecG [Solirubrobacterales bacterium]|nr:ATP-dependent DNA helicase RecG [Solirubrobacterales bacterium]
MVAAGSPIARSFAGGSELTRAQLLDAPVHWPRPSALDISLKALEGVGPKLAEAAAEAGIGTVGDLLLRFPHSHRDRTIIPVASLEPKSQATVLVEVLGAPSAFRRRSLSILSVKVGDDSGSIRATWFNQPWVARKVQPGIHLLLTGSRDKRGFRVSEYELLEEGGDAPPAQRRPVFRPAGAGGQPHDSPGEKPSKQEEHPRPPSSQLVPVHPATEALKAQRIRQWMEQTIGLVGNVLEPLPVELRVRRGLAGAADAVKAVHFPESEVDVEQARERLAFEELFLYQALLTTRKRSHRTARPAPKLGKPGEAVGRWIESLPFEPTRDQLKAFDEIDADLDSGEPMQRLLMGEVGSGKTVVALYSMLRALEAGFQAVLMAPTETLAEQHAVTLGKLLAEDATPFALLTGATPAARRREALERLATGELGLAVGTHALIDPAVRFARLGVCVVDEQHRFGVEQRRALDEKRVEGMVPHVLHMTATPIPRTLSLTAYGDLDTTALHELPAGRQPVETRLVEEDDRAAAYDFLRAQLREGRQAYVVCPLVEESEKMQGKAAEKEAARLQAEELSGFLVGVIHGQMPSARKAEAMEAFASGATDVLVATTVIEVGIDVANATVMIIEGAERYGVSQLHQLRGRVGRGAHSSHCLLFPEDAGGMARRRLKAVERERDGFKLAEVDLTLRGEGEVLGTRQHGLPRFAVAELPEETPILVAARDEVLTLLRDHGSLDVGELGPLLDAAYRRFGAGASDPIPL